MRNFPIYRLRRLRSNENLRRMVRETKLSVDDLIYPMFAAHGHNLKSEIDSMPQCYRFSPDLLAKECKEVKRLGIPAVILFGVPRSKDYFGSEAYAKDGIIQQAVKAIKDAVPELIVIADVCLCEYTDHGHCGVVHDGQLLNDPTLDLLVKTALSQVEAGADMVAPSDMMDGRVKVIREALDQGGYSHVPIMAYSAKYASGFYGPFRDAAGSVPQFGDRRSYQMDFSNSDEALREIELDIQEGADIVMVKPALAYLDIICRAKEKFNIPVAAYNVSGEYSMLKAAASRGWVDEKRAAIEVLTSIKRAGADLILTYFAKEAVRWLEEE